MVGEAGIEPGKRHFQVSDGGGQKVSSSGQQEPHVPDNAMVTNLTPCLVPDTNRIADVNHRRKEKHNQSITETPISDGLEYILSVWDQLPVTVKKMIVSFVHTAIKEDSL